MVLLNSDDTPFPIESIPDDVVGHDKFVQFLLQVVVLKSQQVCVVLESMQLLLVAMAGLQEGFVALANGFELTRQRLKLVIVIHKGLLTAAHIAIELPGASTFRLLLADELPLCLQEESIPLVGILAVFLQVECLCLISLLLCACDLVLRAAVLKLHRFMVKSVV